MKVQHFIESIVIYFPHFILSVHMDPSNYRISLNKYFQCLVHSNQVLDAIIIIIVIINYSSSSRNWSEAHHNMNLLRSCLFSRATQLSPLGTPSSALDGAALASPKATQAPSCSLTWEKPERNT